MVCANANLTSTSRHRRASWHGSDPGAIPGLQDPPWGVSLKSRNIHSPPATNAPECSGMKNYWLSSAFVLAFMVGMIVFGLKLALPGW
jgi:hypothetical protein